MSLDYDYLMGLAPMETIHDVGRRDTILYALGVGVGSEQPCDPGELQFVHEDGLKALPMMAVVLAYPGFWAKDPKYGLNWRHLLHGERSFDVHESLPVGGRLRGLTNIDEIYDTGAGQRGVDALEPENLAGSDRCMCSHGSPIGIPACRRRIWREGTRCAKAPSDA